MFELTLATILDYVRGTAPGQRMETPKMILVLVMKVAAPIGMSTRASTSPSPRRQVVRTECLRVGPKHSRKHATGFLRLLFHLLLLRVHDHHLSTFTKDQSSLTVLEIRQSILQLLETHNYRLRILGKARLLLRVLMTVLHNIHVPRNGKRRFSTRMKNQLTLAIFLVIKSCKRVS
jgi:hypothetical protein